MTRDDSVIVKLLYFPSEVAGCPHMTGWSKSAKFALALCELLEEPLRDTARRV